MEKELWDTVLQSFSRPNAATHAKQNEVRRWPIHCSAVDVRTAERWTVRPRTSVRRFVRSDRHFVRNSHQTILHKYNALRDRPRAEQGPGSGDVTYRIQDGKRSRPYG